MNDAAMKLLEDALALPENERREIGEALLDSVEDPGGEVAGAWRAEVLRRVDAIRSGAAAPERASGVQRYHPAAKVEIVDAIARVERERGLGGKLRSEVERVAARLATHPESGALLTKYPRELAARAYSLNTFRYAFVVCEIAGERVVTAFSHERRAPGQ